MTKTRTPARSSATSPVPPASRRPGNVDIGTRCPVDGGAAAHPSVSESTSVYDDAPDSVPRCMPCEEQGLTYCVCEYRTKYTVINDVFDDGPMDPSEWPA